MRTLLRPYLSLLIILPESKSVSKRDLTALVREVNDTQLEEEEILSDRVYYYDREYKLLRILRVLIESVLSIFSGMMV